MDEPLVCCILPYHIPDYFEQAIECFNAQTYANKQLVAVDTSGMPRIHGMVRNNLIALTPRDCLIAHWDHDDWSCPTRIEQQAAFIQETKAKVVAYRDMPFYDVRTRQVTFWKAQPKSALGTSLMYWRSTWECTPFIQTAGDEDSKFVDTVGLAHLQTQSTLPGPKMIARIHAKNTSGKGGARYEKATPELTAAVLACIRALIMAR